MLEPRDATYDELLAFHTPALCRFCARALCQRAGLSGWGRYAGFSRRLRGCRRVVGATLNARDAIMAGRVPPRLRADRRPASCGARPRRRLLRVQRLRCGDRAVAQAVQGLSASPMSTSMRTTATGCSTGLRMTPAVIFADLHEDGRYLYPGTGAPRRPGGARPRARSSICRWRRVRTMPCSREVWPQVIAHLERFEPEFIILQCGADSIDGDPITHLRFTPQSAWPRGARAGAACRPAGPRTGAGARRRGLQPRQSRAGLDRRG